MFILLYEKVEQVEEFPNMHHHLVIIIKEEGGEHHLLLHQVFLDLIFYSNPTLPKLKVWNISRKSFAESVLSILINYILCANFIILFCSVQMISFLFVHD